MPSCVKRRKKAGRPRKGSKPLCKKSSRKSSRKSSKKKKSSKKRKSTGKRKSSKKSSKKYLKGVKGSPDLETLEDCTKKFHISHVRTLAKGLGVRSGTKMQMCAGILEKMETKKGEARAMEFAKVVPPSPRSDKEWEDIQKRAARAKKARDEEKGPSYPYRLEGKRLGSEWKGKRVVF
jgi:hypothetical protein